MTDLNRYERITPRQVRAARALLAGEVTREQLDRIAHASNSPEVIAQLRRCGLPVKTRLVQCIDYDGYQSKYGVYWLDEDGKITAREMLGGGRHVE